MRKVIEFNTIGSEFESAKHELYDLQSSMNDAADNMPEQLSRAHSDAAVRLDYALSNLYDCEPPAELRDTEVYWSQWSGKIFRPQRRDNIVSFLRAYLVGIPQTDSTEELRADLREVIEILNGVFFPGMSGRQAA